MFLLADDLGWSDSGCYGHPWHRTPNIDRLASEGMRFTNGYSPAPICSAARASLLTGQAVARLRFEFVTKDEAGPQKMDSQQPLLPPPYTLNLPLAEQTIAEALSERNYRTAFFGKWHVSQHHQRYLGWHPKFGPKQQGFHVADEDFGDHPYSWKRNSPPNLLNGEFPDDTMVNRAVDFIRESHDKPFFLMISSFYVHTPVKNRCRWLVKEYEDRIPADSPNRNQRLEYAAIVETLDHHVGTLLNAIDHAGLRDSTLVVFMSDNGGHPEYCANAPLRGSKWNLYEGGIRVPFIARWPGHVASTKTCDTPVIGYDLLPTFVDIAGGSMSNVDGVSLRPAFDGSNWKPDRSLLWHFPYYHPESTYSRAIEQIGISDFAVSKTRPQSALRRSDYKIITFAEDNRVELYDLASDVGEQQDLSKRLPDVAARLKQELEQRLTQMKARRATRNPRFIPER
ncbi:MAG: sulfatase [Planctomycetaceae bacterium]